MDRWTLSVLHTVFGIQIKTSQGIGQQPPYPQMRAPETQDLTPGQELIWTRAERFCPRHLESSHGDTCWCIRCFKCAPRTGQVDGDGFGHMHGEPERASLQAEREDDRSGERVPLLPPFCILVLHPHEASLNFLSSEPTIAPMSS